MSESTEFAPPRQRLTSTQFQALVSRLHALTPDDAAAIDSTDLIREDRDAR